MFVAQLKVVPLALFDTANYVKLKIYRYNQYHHCPRITGA